MKRAANQWKLVFQENIGLARLHKRNTHFEHYKLSPRALDPVSDPKIIKRQIVGSQRTNLNISLISCLTKQITKLAKLICPYCLCLLVNNT